MTNNEQRFYTKGYVRGMQKAESKFSSKWFLSGIIIGIGLCYIAFEIALMLKVL